MRLSGSLFVRNAIKYDYCVIESIQSLLGVCDEVVVLECSSDDETLKLLRSIRSPKLRLLSDARWDCAVDSSRLAILANLAKSVCSHPLHFMLQADEVIHEASYNKIRYWCRQKVDHSVSVRRWNFYGDPKRVVSTDIPMHEKPCDDHPTRLGPVELMALGDGESIHKVNDVIDLDIQVCHYGYIRKPMPLIEKLLDSFEWFNGGVVDKRIYDMRKHGKYIWSNIMRDDQLVKYKSSHPKVMRQWLEQRYEQS